MSSRESRRPSNDMGKFGGHRVYVGDIGRTNRTDLEREFGQYGPVIDVWMGRKRDPTQQSFAFVVFRYPEDAEEAVQDRNGRKVCGRTVRVEHAKPVNSNPRRQRGWGGGGGGRGGDYGPPRGGPPRRRSRERYSRRSPPSPGRGMKGQQSPTMSRRHNDSFNDSPPKKVSRHSTSESPEPSPKKLKKSKRQMSPSTSPPPQSRSKQQLNDSDSYSSPPSPPSKKKKKQKKRERSPSQSPEVSDEYDARQYQQPRDGRGDGRTNKASKKNNYVESDGYSSDGY